MQPSSAVLGDMYLSSASWPFHLVVYDLASPIWPTSALMHDRTGTSVPGRALERDRPLKIKEAAN
jgi:hypothetical protein